MSKVDRLLIQARALGGVRDPLRCLLPDGTEAALGLFQAMEAGASYLGRPDGRTEWDALYRGLLDTRSMDFSGVLEV